MSETIMARGTKRPADESSDDEGPRARPGFIRRPVEKPSSTEQTGTTVEGATPLHVAPGQIAAENQSTTVEETAEQTQEIIQQAMEEAGPIPTDPQDVAEYKARVIDGSTTIRQNKADAAKFASLLINKKLSPQDEAWITKHVESLTC